MDCPVHNFHFDTFVYRLLGHTSYVQGNHGISYHRNFYERMLICPPCNVSLLDSTAIRNFDLRKKETSRDTRGLRVCSRAE